MFFRTLSRRAAAAATIVAVAACLLGRPAEARADDRAPDAVPLRCERIAVEGGAEIFTVFGDSDASRDVPFVSILNDTLGTADTADDQLRYVWVYSYCPPTVSQRVLASIPFLYVKYAGRGRTASPGSAPPAIFDFSKPADPLWKKIAWYAMQAAVLDPHGWVFGAGSRTYARNEAEYRKAHIGKGLSVLAQYREAGGEIGPLADDRDFELAYARLVQNGFAGAFLNDRHLERVYRNDTSESRLRIGHNWELLRQRCEEQGLYFEPLEGTGGRAEHALVWVRRDEIERSAPTRAFDARFLNIKSPWSDDALRSWKGYSRVMFADGDGRLSPTGTEGTRPVDMIPLAIYGLDFPKIPALLVDFRSVFNPRRRELSRHAVDDVWRYVLRTTPIGDLQLFVAKRVYNTIVGRKGVDVSQPTRALTYAQLRTLLVLNDLFEPELRAIVMRDLERLKVNPLDNGPEAEARIARSQYDALRKQVASGDLSARLERDRSSERVRLEHGRVRGALFKVATVATLGLYRHRDDGAASRDRYALARALAHHRAVLADVASAPAPIEVTWDPAKFRPSLEFAATHATGRDDVLARSVEAIFRGCEDPTLRELAVDALLRIDGPVARRALDAIAADETLPLQLRERGVARADATTSPAAVAAGTR